MEEPGQSRRVLLRLLGYLAPYRWYVIGQYAFMFVIIALGLLSPQLMRMAIDGGVKAQDTRTLSLAVLGLIGLTAVKGVLSFFQGRWSEVASQGVAFDLRNAIHRKLASLSFAYHDRTETGQHLSRAIQDVDRVRFLTGRAILRLAEGIVLFLGAFGFLLSMNRTLTLAVAVTFPILAIQSYLLGSRLRPLSLRIQNQLASLTTRLEQNLRGTRVVKAFAQEDAEIERFDRENRLWFDLSARSARLQSFLPTLLALTGSLGTVAIIWFGGREVVRGTLTYGGLVAFIAYLTQLMEPVRRFGQVIPAIAIGIASGARVLEILDARSEVLEKPDALPLPRGAGLVRFDRVTFCYAQGSVALDEVSFEARPGQTVALLGATGCGKSTIIQLIPRFYDVSSGAITIDGYDIRGVTIQSLRDQIGIVLQDTTLFATTIRENITFGNPDATEREMEAAARAAQAHEFIAQLPDGYDQVVGEKGVTLSGGQRQRVAIARALLKDPRILILDDATSSVDTGTEHLIQQALTTLMRGRTSFVIAQRLSTVRNADRIVVLDGGRVEALGTHAELIERSGTYADIFEHQLEPDRREGTQ
jgi:ATP-binding cassette, subfamily B, multidrug efflux pump